MEFAYLGAAIGAGMIVIGAGLGIGKLAAAAAAGIARQPEAAGDIRGGMMITAVFIEGATLFGVVVCLLLSLGVMGYLGAMADVAKAGAGIGG